MIKSNELRIGNLVDMCGVKEIHSIIKTTNGSFKLEINEKRSSGVSVSEMCPIESLSLKPIPLSNVWLVRFGFKLSEEGFLKIKTKKRKTYLEVNIKTKRTIVISGHYFNDFVNINYVHQLQNLYFSLTGVELELPSNVA
ncbi:hypothetical protein UFOVP104_16 [uncultured Caudovirales phage]|uniref:Uncharacterized protein n=1 Tax=uncultured Caudovirales phage TaxID=2100421 RepID=A0A6J5LN38_9CAUD|nr:hypothetical protein UFOVP104_16 [uncultured Caudovirales phage]CAB4134370.1 hypothetical protein UFOVP271_51 [uncultured Caudovirales phage]